MNEGLAELTKDRQEHVKSCLKNGDESHKILSELYSDPAHFIDELLQNADDAEAEEVRFELTGEHLTFKHDGRPFDLNDVDSITKIGKSTKKDDINQIGKFGVGFKSVFAVTEAPEIHSGDYHLSIIDYIVPEAIASQEANESTRIILPFNHPDKSAGHVYQKVAERLENLESESLLFLRSIQEIQWETQSDKGHYMAEIREDDATLISERGTSGASKNDLLKDYIIFKEDIVIKEKPLNIAIAYLKEGNKIIPVPDPRLHVFFSTKEEPRLKFLVHAPYKTTPTRESINFEDAQNKKITDALSTLIAQSIDKIKAQHLLDADFLSILPIYPEESHPLYVKAFEKVREALLSNDLLPTSNKTHVKAENALLARGKDLADLLNAEDCSTLFNRTSWLDTSITQDRTSALWKYLQDQLEIPLHDMASFCKKIDQVFMAGKTDQWVIQFYSSAKENESLYTKLYWPRGILRRKPIIRLQDGSHESPDDENDEIQVYLPATDRESEFKTIKKEILHDEAAKAFLTALGLKEPDDIAEIREFVIPKYDGSHIEIERDDYVEDFRKVFSIWKNSDEDRKKEIVNLIGKTKFVWCQNPAQNPADQFLCQPGDVYFDSEKLKSWFAGNPDESIYFIDADLLADGESRKFLKALGVRDEIKIQGTENIDLQAHGFHERSVDGFNADFDIHGLDFALQDITIERSKMIWEILLIYPNKLRGYIDYRTRKSDDWQRREEPQKSKALKAMEEVFWLYDGDDQLIEKPPGEIELDDLSDDYKKDDDNIDKLIKALGLKLDIIKQFEEATGMMAVLPEEYSEFEKWKEQEKIKHSRNKSETRDEPPSWEPDVDVGKVEITEDTSGHYQHTENDLSGQVSQVNKEDDDTDKGRAEKSSAHSNEYRNSKEIGQFGESLAKRHLEEKYPEHEVVWLNDGGNIGKGYDFVIKKEDEEVFYYEVKSKVNSAPQLFDISGAQWDWAKRLNRESRGDMYKILLISNAGKKESKVKELSDPVALWGLGELYADPVRIKL